jgi:hypothetical protein
VLSSTAVSSLAGSRKQKETGNKKKSDGVRLVTVVKDTLPADSVPKFYDKLLECADCKTDFTLEAGEQYFFWQKGWPEPRRCPGCRRLRKIAIQDR